VLPSWPRRQLHQHAQASAARFLADDGGSVDIAPTILKTLVVPLPPDLGGRPFL
jgi:hypothetical protein